MDNKKIEAAKKLLEKNGYYTENLWQICDVQMLYNCDKNQAMKVLSKTMQSERIQMEIFESIHIQCEEMGFDPIEN
jgi:hypothetical protein